MNVCCVLLIVGKCQKNASLSQRERGNISVHQDSYFREFVGEFAVFRKEQTESPAP